MSETHCICGRLFVECLNYRWYAIDCTGTRRNSIAFLINHQKFVMRQAVRLARLRVHQNKVKKKLACNELNQVLDKHIINPVINIIAEYV